MKRPMHPVLREIGDQQERGHLDQERQRSDGRADRSDPRPVEQDERRFERENRQNLDEQRVDEEIGQIDRPLPAEDRLAGPEREQPFQRHEDRRIEKQIQNEEIEPEPGTGAHVALDRDHRPAKQRGGEREPDADERQRLVRAQKSADAAEEEGRDERDVDDRAQVLERIETAQFRVRQVLREMEAEHGAETGDAEERREQTADEAVAERRGLGGFEREMRRPRTRRISHAALPAMAAARHTAVRTAGHRAAAARR
jgi:hypothetical protein